VSEGGDEAARGTIDVDGHMVTAGRLVFIQKLSNDVSSRTILPLWDSTYVAHLLHRLVMPSVGASQNDEHTNRVLIHKLHRPLGIQSILALDTDRYEPALDVEVSGELLKGNLCVGAHDDIGTGFVNTLSSSFALFLPDTFHSETAELNGFGGAGGGGSDGIVGVRSVPEIREHGNATLMDYLCKKTSGKNRKTDRRCLRVMGYSSWSIKFLFMFSIMSLSASSGIQVCTNDARSNHDA
jgi:hypothetical protein